MFIQHFDYDFSIKCLKNFDEILKIHLVFENLNRLVLDIHQL